MIKPPRMDDTTLMRYPPRHKQRVVPIQPVLDWSAWNVHNNPVTEETTAPGTGDDPAQGLAMHVEMCNNNGHCRKFDAGTMCPSYRVTRDEQHLTRGRANTLRLALSGQLEPRGPGQRGIHEAVRIPWTCAWLQGLQARLPHRRGHGQAQDRVPATLQGEARPHAEGQAGRPVAGLRAPRREDCPGTEPARQAAAHGPVE
jgi:hypothetical protein